MSVMTEPSLHDVIALADEVWTSFLGADQPLLPGEPIDPDAATVSASVTVSGAWHGVVSLQVPDDLARAIAAAMLGGLPEVDDADVSDAIGEMVNMVGGNVKSLMPGPSALSLPVVALGRLAFPSDAIEVVRADLSWRGEAVKIAVHMPRS
jgi:chemotaxis protein CheX